jgi:glucan phosphoethanolaminetransferase (alkaline phosphatase superfamily)
VVAVLPADVAADAVTGHCVMPFFGTFLTDAPAAMFCLALAALWSYAAWLIYQVKPQGWWLIMIAMVVFMASGLATFARHDWLEMYQLMGYPQAQIDQIQKAGLLAGNRMRWLMACSALPFLVYLLFIKKYFRAKS